MGQNFSLPVALGEFFDFCVLVLKSQMFFVIILARCEMKVYELNDVMSPDEKVVINKNMYYKMEPMHSHKFWEIAYVYSGRGYQLINGKKFFVKRGDLMIFTLHDKHSFDPDGGLGIFNCILTPQFLSESLTNSSNALDVLSLTSFSSFNLDNIDTLVHFENKTYYEIENIFEAMYTEFTHKETNYATVLNNYIGILFTKTFRNIHNSNPININNEISRITSDVLQYIADHYNEKITLTELSQKSFYSPSYFSHIFKECYNKTLTNYIMEIRIDKATEMLRETDKSIEAIANSVGYTDMKTFYTAFKKVAGTTPNKFRFSVKK